MGMPALKRPSAEPSGARDPNVVEIDGARRLREARAEWEPEIANTATIREPRREPARLEDILADLEGSSTLHLAPDEAEADCEALLAEVRESLTDALEEAGGVITAGPLPTLPMPANQVAQIFQILVSNAFRYRSERAPRIHVRAERDGRRWQILVEDNGRGVSPEERVRIFERFHRGEESDGVPGTGIGLSVCKRIVEAHGGRIWVKPSVTGGAVFVFTAPVAEAQRQA